MPNYGIVTNCGKAHIDGFGGIEGVRKGKGELFDYIRGNEGVIFLNNDLDYLNPMSLGIMNIITYGVTAHADYTIVQKADESMTLSVVASNKDETISIHSNLVGEYNLPNIALAFAVGAYFKVPLQNIKNAIEHYHPDNSRSQLIKTASNQVILDAYNANPTSMRAAIHNFSKLPGEKFLWLGAMKEMGEEEANEHRDLVSFIKQWHWAQVVLVGQEFRPHTGEFPWFLDSSLAAEFVEKQKPQNTLILIKGSRGSKMEKLFDAIKAI
jgi:UDP-N-acetylmuramoyl-tripeptide--D-alanyl-D-alanine ligase